MMSIRPVVVEGCRYVKSASQFVNTLVTLMQQSRLPTFQKSLLCRHFVTRSQTAHFFSSCQNVYSEATTRSTPDRLYSTANTDSDFLSEFSKDLDLDALRQQRLKEQRATGKTINVFDIVKLKLAEKCDEAVANLSKEDQRKLSVIQLEHDFLYSEGYAIPDKDEMINEYWLEALNLPSKKQRLRFYIACQKKHFSRRNQKLKRSEKAETERTPVPKDDNKIMIWIYETTMKRWLNHQLAAAMKFGLPLVVDMDYVDFMPLREQKNTAKQLMDLYCLNRSDQQLPFHLHFTGCPDDNPLYRRIQLAFHDDPHFMATVTPESPVDVFPKEDLVYLSPNARKVMTKFDPTKVYIIGGFNDKGTQKPISYAKAIKQGIQCQRLPLDEHLKWCTGSKSLTLNQMMQIMQAIKNKKSWIEALDAVPKRKLRPSSRNKQS